MIFTHLCNFCWKIHFCNKRFSNDLGDSAGHQILSLLLDGIPTSPSPLPVKSQVLTVHSIKVGHSSAASNSSSVRVSKLMFTYIMKIIFQNTYWINVLWQVCGCQYEHFVVVRSHTVHLHHQLSLDVMCSCTLIVTSCSTYGVHLY